VSPSSNTLAEYLRARRAQLKPEDAGYPADPGRRVAGLKREEVAELAGISLEYYTRLEQGRFQQVSEHVLSGLARALRLQHDDAAYLYRLALPEPPASTAPTAVEVTETLRQLVDQWSDFPLFVFDRNQDIRVSNDLARELFPLLVPGNNNVESVFQVPASTRELEGWKTLARNAVAALRYEGDPADPRLREIVGGLSVRDAEFRSIWANHEARPLASGTVPAFIEGFGSGEFPWHVLNVPGGLFMTVWVALPGTFAGDATVWLRNRIRSASHR